eukprot:364562-Chlamydomonas_euryale.AAC.1
MGWGGRQAGRSCCLVPCLRCRHCRARKFRHLPDAADVVARPPPAARAVARSTARVVARPTACAAARPTAHATARPTAHAAARPTVHAAARSTVHAAARSTVHVAARSTVHAAARSTVHASGAQTGTCLLRAERKWASRAPRPARAPPRAASAQGCC